MTLPWSKSSVIDFLKNGAFEDTKQEISKDIMAKKLDLATFIEELGPALTSPEVEMRLKGTKLLSDIVALIDNDYLNEVQLNFLTTFYIDRLKDHHSVLPAVISGVLSMIQMKHFPNNMSAKLLVALFQNVTCQSQVRDDRANIFRIFKELSEIKPAELLAMGPDFIYGVINAIDGERDPRNLLFLFTYMPVFVNKFPLHHLSEEMFEIFSCYFPIDFYPAPNDPAAITRDILAQNLSNCLCASESFADDCIVLILEKIESQLVIAKLDSFDLLTKCTKNFPFDKIESNFDKIWIALKLELLHSGDNKEILAAAVTSLEAIVVAASKAETSKSIEFILNTIFTAILSNLMDVNSRLFAKSMKVCFICARASAASNLYIVDKLIPIFLQQIQNDDAAENEDDEKITRKCTIFEMLTELFAISRANNVVVQLNSQHLTAVQTELIKPLTTILAHSVPLPNVHSLGLLKTSLNCLSKICDVLTDNNRLLVYSMFNLVLTSDTLMVSIEDLLVVFASNSPNEVMEMVIQPLIKSEANNNKVFHTLAQLLALETFTNTVIEFFVKYIFPADAKLSESECRVQLLALKNLKLALEDNSQTEMISTMHNRYNLIEKFVGYIQANQCTDADFLYISSQTMCTIIKKLTIEQQLACVKTYMPLLKLQTVSDLYLASGILGYLDKAVPLEDHFEELVEDLTKLALTTKDDAVKQLCNQVMCSLFNKMPDNDKHRNILKKILLIFKDEVKQHKNQAVEGLSWIAKGLLSRGHVEAAEVIQDLTELLDHPTLKNAAALAFDVISNEYPGLHLPVVKHLFQQKLFMLVMKTFENKLEHMTEHHLTAVAFVMKMTPHVVLKMNIAKVGPWLLKCLQLEKEKPVLITLQIVNRFLSPTPDEYFSSFVSELIQRCLKLSIFKPSMTVRIQSLVCLKNLTNFSLFLIVPYKQDVLLGLLTCLDDNKRLVRAAAVESRLAWFLIGSENKEK